jgi:very-short-patch-repair endonuclease
MPMGSEREKDLVKKARALRRRMSTAEIILWTKLRSRKIDGYKFRRQQPIYDYIVDFYCHELMLVIEVDGEIHSLKEIKEYDNKREKILTLNGYHLIRLTNFEIETQTDSALARIRSYMAEISSPFQGDHRGLSS